ncbi:hypothetical protein EG68_10116 [Paragonimus skrjabini miyazakii]|uniref:Histone deacetylase domain-containing protein n=1 Tax=Paragonimus skrjabini miyazakii TaxID=59628 RepID=A0A8S9Z4X7_9TREM|nr:hypothetical protein EG68_10116 [Paragonimus skrjabini miyazakii]
MSLWSTSCDLQPSTLSKATGLVYDQRMTLHKHEWFANEQETPARIQRAFKRCQEEGLVMRCTMIPAHPVSMGALTLIHSRQYIRSIKQTRSLSLQELYNFSGQFDGVFFNQSTWDSACLAVGSLKHLANLVVRGRLANGFAFLRPPGHHAMYAEACGYCVLNNVAAVAASFLDPPPKVIKPTEQTRLVSKSKHLNKSIAAEHLQHLCPVSNSPSISGVSSSSESVSAVPICRSKSTPKLERILIVDWDVHHGQGTQYTFYNDNRVLFVSIHRYERGTFWPNLREANFDFVGEGPGRGYNVNIPLDDIGLSDSDYLAIFHQLLMPIAIEFNPQLVLVSCGFDAAIGCPEGRMWLSPSVFGHFVHHLKILAGGKLVIALEVTASLYFPIKSIVHITTVISTEYRSLSLYCHCHLTVSNRIIGVQDWLRYNRTVDQGLWTELPLPFIFYYKLLCGWQHIKQLVGKREIDVHQSYYGLLVIGLRWPHLFGSCRADGTIVIGTYLIGCNQVVPIDGHVTTMSCRRPHTVFAIYDHCNHRRIWPPFLLVRVTALS